MTDMWMVRAGEGAFLIDEFKNRNIVAVGWGIGDVLNKSKDELKSILKKKYPNEKDKTIEKWASVIFRFWSTLKIGDYVLSAFPKSKKYLLGKIISDYYYSNELIEERIDSTNNYNNLRDVKWICEIPREGLSEDTNKSLGSIVTLFNINDKAKEEILNFSNADFNCDDSAWKNEKRNLIYFGAPGTGKSYILNEEKKRLLSSEDDYIRVTFHPDYSYANFVGTYKPVPKIIEKDGKEEESISYEYVPGPFMRSLVKALKEPKKPFLLIIEEINRSNVAGVFGDVFQLLDRDEKNNSSYDIETSKDMRNYLKKEFNKDIEKIKIPCNMFIWATMNSADQGVFPMDTAFKRRWDFKYLEIDNNQEEIENIKIKSKNQEISWNELRKEINGALLSFRINEDKLLGPFFAFDQFKDKENFNEDDFEEINEIFKNKVLMYLFEDAARSKRDKLFKYVKGNNDNIIFSEVCKSFDDEGVGIFCDKIRNKFIND